MKGRRKECSDKGKNRKRRKREVKRLHYRKEG